MNTIIHKCKEQDLIEYLDSLKDTPNTSFNDFIKSKYFAKDKDSIVIASLAEQEINGADLKNANLQGTILKGAVFNDCDFTNTILCDTDLTDVKFNDCKFIDTDFRGANLHYVDFKYEDHDGETFPNLKDKIQGIKVSISDLEKLNKYIDKDLEKEKENLPLSLAKGKELENKKEELKALKQNLDNPGIFTAFANAVWNSQETIDQNREYQLKKIEELNHTVNKLETEIYALDNLRMFCGQGLETIFKQLSDEKVKVTLDPSYIIGSKAEERDKQKTQVKVTSEDFEKYLAEATKHPSGKLSLTEFIRKEKSLAQDLNIIPNLSDIDLSGKTLNNLDLRHALFASANLEKTTISDCNLDYANFEGANLRNVTLQNVTARNAGFLFADLKSCKIENSDISRSYMPKVDLTESEITNSKLNAVMMVNADAANITIKDSECKNSDLTGISLAYAEMQKVQMQGVILNNALLDQANVISSEFEDAFMNKAHALEAKFKDTNMKGLTARESYFTDSEFKDMLSMQEVDFRAAVMERIKLKNADLTRAKLDKANLEYADLTNATLTKASAKFANLSNATLEKANAEGLDISDSIAKNINAKEANFKGIIAQRADLTKANLEKAILEDAELQAVNAAEAIFKEANVKRANLKAANLTNINAENANFDGAKIDDATRMHSVKGEAKGVLEHQGKDGKKFVNVNEHIKLEDKIHAREKSGWFLKTGIGQLCTKLTKAVTSGVGSTLNFLASKKFLLAVAVVAGAAVAAAPFVTLPMLLVTGTALATKVAIAGASILVGGAVAAATYKLTQKPLRKMQKAFENLTSGIDKYISPPPADIDDLVEKKQQAEQKAKSENAQKREENLNEVNNNIDKSKEQDILKQAQNKLNPLSKEKHKTSEKLEEPKAKVKFTEKIKSKINPVVPGVKKNNSISKY